MINRTTYDEEYRLANDEKIAEHMAKLQLVAMRAATYWYKVKRREDNHLFKRRSGSGKCLTVSQSKYTDGETKAVNSTRKSKAEGTAMVQGTPSVWMKTGIWLQILRVCSRYGETIYLHCLSQRKPI